MLSYEIYKIFKNTFFYEKPPVVSTSFSPATGKNEFPWRTIRPFILGYFQEKVTTVVSTSFSPATGKDEFPWRTIRPFILGYFQEKVTTKFCGNSSKLYFCAIWILFADFRTNKKFYGKSTFVAFLILDFCHSGKFRKRLMAGA